MAASLLGSAAILDQDRNAAISAAEGNLGDFSAIAQALKTMIVQGTPVHQGAPMAHFFGVSRTREGRKSLLSDAEPEIDDQIEAQLAYYEFTRKNGRLVRNMAMIQGGIRNRVAPGLTQFDAGPGDD